ncbi:MAG: 4Fe-4S dicluster domain-containing protein [Firmicutes bacterium]|nr:4Fe-4S dicluster domain-containing protein [Bacillota bacterium]
MVRKIIKIDKTKCNGCGLCAAACHEGAIGMVDGVATLLRDDYCDGLGDCLPACPTGAISFEEREALAYDEEAVKVNMAKRAAEAEESQGCTAPKAQPARVDSQLQNWPPQIKLAPIQAPYYDGANLLIAADCTCFSYGSFHNDFMKNRVTLIGCPKLDAVDYSQKLAEIIKHNDIASITVTRMEVPCCGGIEFAVKKAVEASGKFIPLQVITISTTGKILRRQ